MKTYLVTFNTHADTAYKEISASSPEAALAEARRIAEDDPDALWFQPFDGSRPVEDIIVSDDQDNQLCAWHDDDVCLRLVAGELLEAARAVLARWKRGDRAAAIRGLQRVVARHDRLRRAANSRKGVRL